MSVDILPQQMRIQSWLQSAAAIILQDVLDAVHSSEKLE